MTTPSTNKKRTRHSSSTKLAEYLGAGVELLPTEVPTLRDVLRKGLLIQEEKMLLEGGGRKNYPVKDMIVELTTVVYSQWEKSNFKFKPPVLSDKKVVVKRLQYAWEKVNAIALKKETKPSVVNVWEAKLDNLFDITLCQCPITLCDDTPHPPCKTECKAEAHISCTCTAPQKLPLLDLAWVKGQRDKIGSKSKHQLYKADLVETMQQEKTAKRKHDDSEALLYQKKKAEEEEERIFSTVVDMPGKN